MADRERTNSDHDSSVGVSRVTRMRQEIPLPMVRISFCRAHTGSSLQPEFPETSNHAERSSTHSAQRFAKATETGWVWKSCSITTANGPPLRRRSPPVKSGRNISWMLYFQPKSGQERLALRRLPAAPILRRSARSQSRRQLVCSGPVSDGLSPRAARLRADQ